MFIFGETKVQMKVKINNKVFDVTVEAGNNKVILEVGLNEGDMLFFKQWMNRSLNSEYASQYKKDLHFATDAKKGLLNGCFPMIKSESSKTNVVEIIYDQIKYNQ